jgi:hypothetical protein
MNDRIKELCEHAKAYATECTKHFTGDEPIVWMDYYTEKFAQLIAQESIVDFYRRYLDICTDEDITVQVERYVKKNISELKNEQTNYND